MTNGLLHKASFSVCLSICLYIVIGNLVYMSWFTEKGQYEKKPKDWPEDVVYSPIFLRKEKETGNDNPSIA